ncbi:Tfp pilus assembly protein PilF [Lachnospiraceae bacterium YSD2013]|nr:Tfp pilus assembly protein PilF [Lachnospiraceae bacterium YSD2013]
MFFHVRYAKINSMKKKLLTIITTAFVASAALLSGCGKKPTMYYDTAYAYLLNNQYPEARDNFLKSLAEEDDRKDAYRGLGIAYIANGEYDEGAAALIKALEKSNGRIKEVDYDINYYLGYAYEKAGKYQEAADVYTAIVNLRPKDTDAYYRRALCRLKTEDKTGADTDFAKVTAGDNDNYDLHIDIFYSILNAGFEAEADAYLKAILEDGNRKISDYDRGRMHYCLGDYSNARVYLEKAKVDTDPESILVLGKTYEAMSDYSYAASLYATYLEKKGNNAAVYNQLGVCRWKLNDYEGALSAFSFGLKLDAPEWEKELLYNEAVTYEYLLDFDTAREKMEAYLEKYPKDEAAQHEALFLATRHTRQ